MKKGKISILETIAWLGLISAIVIGMLAGCGSDQTAGIAPELGGTVEITCMDVEYAADTACNAVPEAQNKPLRDASASLLPVAYDAGIISTGVNIWAQAEVTNKSATQAYVYFYTEFNKDGIFSNNTAQTYKTPALSGDTLTAQYGSNPCPDPGPCASAGYWEYVTYIYNAAHLAENESGDPSTDELLAVGVLKFTLEAQ